MTLILTCIAAVIASVVWYRSEEARELKVGTLMYLYWGASIMWFVDFIYEYIELRTAYFEKVVEDMTADTILGITAITFGLIIWLMVIFIKDPKGVIRKGVKVN